RSRRHGARPNGQTRMQRARDRIKQAVAEVYGNRCRACAWSVRDMPNGYNLDHVASDGNGERRAGTLRDASEADSPAGLDTDRTRAWVLATAKKRGEVPWEIELLCGSCHDHQTAVRARGVPWGDRWDTRTGEPFEPRDPDTWVSEIQYTQPVPGPSRR